MKFQMVLEFLQAFQEWLSNGKILCDLMNALQPRSCKWQDTSRVKLEVTKRS